MKGEPLVGLAPGITLSRRVQLAVLAHIRHKHTRYDHLLKEAGYLHARKTVEQLCLDILVKWRGDEETGRDQLDEILREVIVISDSEDESDDEASTEGGSDHESPPEAAVSVGPVAAAPPVPSISYKKPGRRKVRPQKNGSKKGPQQPAPKAGHGGQPRLSSAKRDQRGFKRYQAARLARWDEARDRLIHEEVPDPRAHDAAPMLRSGSHGSQQNWPPHPDALPHTYPRPVEYVAAGPSAAAPENRPAVVGPYRDPVPANSASNHPSDLFVAARPVQSVVHGHRRVPSGHSWAASEPPPAVQDRQPGPRAVVRSENLQDYLVPSVEPPSPSPNRSGPPGFARTVPTPGHQDDRAGMPVSYFRRSPPVQYHAMDEPNKRRRIVEEQYEPVRFAPAYGPNRPTVLAGHDRDWAPREPAIAIPLREPLREPPRERPARPPTLASKTHFVDANGAVLREEPGRPIVVEEWTTEPSRPSRQYPPRSYEERAQAPRPIEFIELTRPVYSESQLPEGHRIISVERVQAPPREGYARAPMEYIPVSKGPPRSAPPPEMRPLRATTNRNYVDSPPPIFVRRVEVTDDPSLAPRFIAPVRRDTVYLEGAGPREPPRAEYIPHQ